MTAEELYRQRGGTYQLMGDENGQWQGVANPMLMQQIEQELQAANNPSLLGKLGDIGQSMVPVNYTVGSGGLVNSSGQAVKRVTIPGEFEPDPSGQQMIPKTAWLTQQAAAQLGVPWEGESTQYQSGETGLDRFMMNTVPLATMAVMGAGAMGALPGTGAAAAGGTAGASAGGTAAAGGSLMPAAQAVAPGTLAEWGLVQTAPGVWSAPAMGGAAAGGTMVNPISGLERIPSTPLGVAEMGPQMSSSSLAELGGVGRMPAAIPPGDPTFGGALSQTSPGVFESTVAGGGFSMPPGASTGASTLFGELKDGAKALSPYAPLLGMVAGGTAGALGGSGTPGTITIEEGIPDWLKEYMKPTMDKYSTELQNYQIDPYGVMPAASQEFKNTISGMYLDPSTNKWLEEYFKLGAERVKGAVSPSFGHMQAFGSHSGYNEALSRGLGDFATGLYGGAYNKERDRQTAATAAAPNFLTQQSTAAFAPYQQYLQTLGSLGKKKDQPYWEPSQMQNILGGAMAGYGIGSIFK
jgi:hypothetical protein